MSSEPVIRLRGARKAFPVFERPWQRLLHALWPRVIGRGHEFVALDGVDLEVHRGEAVALVGVNGSGKSTLLQLVCGILQPSAGEVQVHARISALLELGAGFNPEFTGRENARLAAALHGLDAATTEARMQQILDFADIGSHVDQPVKTYSSGMFVRLAFAVAVHSDPDVLVVDEALAVGDVYFQRKCYKRIGEMLAAGCTLLFVTHSMDAVLQMCERAVVLDHGRVVFDGDSREGVATYLTRLFGNAAAPAVPAASQASAGEAGTHGLLPGDNLWQRPGYNRDEIRLGDRRATVCDARLVHADGDLPVVMRGEPFQLLVRYAFHADVDGAVFGVRLRTAAGVVVYSANSLHTTLGPLSARAGEDRVLRFEFAGNLLPGQYFLGFGVSALEARDDGGKREPVALDRRMDAIVLSIVGDRSSEDEGLVDLRMRIEPLVDGGA
jgi:lipopolysaccharide transport system ATP-binding protein